MFFLAAAVLLRGGSASAQDAPYVGSYEAETFFPTISSNEMNVLRTKNILFLSRSFGFNLRDGLERLKNKNPIYNIIGSHIYYDVYTYGLSCVETNAFSNHTFVHVKSSLWPIDKRLDEARALLQDPPYSFANKVDIVMIFYHTATSDLFDLYTNKMDSLQRDFPNIKFIYVTSGLSDSVKYAANNALSAAFGAKVRARYKGNVPLYDLGYILSKDGACGDACCPEYIDDPAGLHPDDPLAEESMGKGFLLMLRDLYFGSGCTSSVPPTVPGNLSGTALSDSSIKLIWDPSEHECAGIARYELTRNGAALLNTTKTNYTDTGLTENTAYKYSIRAVSMAEVASAYAPTSTVSTLVDSTPPTVVSIQSFSSTRISVEFSEAMDPVSAGTAANYTLNNGVSVLSASLSGKTVTLTTSALANGINYTLTVNNAADASSAKNPIIPGSQASFLYLSVIYPQDPTAYWTFNGTTNDLSGNGLNCYWVGTASYGSGLLGQGLALNGLTNGPYAKINHNNLLDGMATLTLSVWAKKDNPAVGGQLFNKNAVYALEVVTNTLKGYIYIITNGVNYAQTAFTAQVPGINDTNWHHYCMVYNGTNVLVYADGVRGTNNTVRVGTVYTLASQPLLIGKSPFGNPPATFAGAIDEVKIFRRALSTNEIDGLKSAGFGGSADRRAVRAILDANNQTNKLVDAISVYQKDRVAKLYLQESGISNVTADIGQLSELTLLHVYGDRALGYPPLTKVAPEIGSCKELTELLLTQNSLTNLPSTITNLTKLTLCSIDENLLCDADPVWESWADTYDPDWRATQDCPSALYMIHSILSGPGNVFPTNRLAIGVGQSTQLVYTANTWHKITNFTGNGTSVPAAIGLPVYTAVYANVSADITNEVAFSVIRAATDGRTPATWYGPFGINPAVDDEDHDRLSLLQEYLINSHPAQSNIFQMISAGMDSERRVNLSWRSLGEPNGQVQIVLQQDLNGTAINPAGTVIYTNGICTWRSIGPVTNDVGFVRLKILETP
jgi:hypothetical protein